ncbi:hydrogenase accessory protein HupE/UreJ protein [Leptolyngbya sp. NIES-3755]|nr:hydrogenase accessory protein HupE/UreJ protein [Leptolyngbya sp. NIES-3755]
MNLLKSSKSIFHAGLVTIALMSIASPAFAHHAMGGKMPSNFFEGFLAGIAHPIIGLDHFAFIVAVGLLAATKRRGILIPIAFVLSAMFGTGLHLAQINVPGVELFVSGSILLFGLLLVKDRWNTAIVTGLSAIAGLFHGYAYGESIFGAEMTPLFAYLAGFTVIQLVVSLAAFWIGDAMVDRHSNANQFRSAGLVFCGIGLAFFVSQVVSILFPI